MSAYPKSFTYALSRLSNFSRQKYRIQTQAQTTFKANDQIVVDLPVGILDMSTFTMHGRLSTTATGGTASSCKAPFMEGLIEALYIEAGGVAIQNITSYNQLFNIFRDYQLFDKQSLRACLQNDAFVQGNNTLANSTVTTNRPFAVYNWLGMLSSMKILDSTLWPQIRLYIRLAPTAALSTVGAPTSVDYTLSNVSFTCDVIDVADGVYGPMISERLRSAPLEVPYENYSTVIGSLGPRTASTRWSTSAHCLEGVIATLLEATYTNGAHIATTNLANYFTRSGTNVTDVQLSVNGVPYPSIPMRVDDGDVFVNTVHAMNVSQDTLGQCNPNMNSLADWRDYFFTAAHSFTYDSDGEESRLCGLDGRGNQILGTFQTTGTGTNALPVIFLRHKSVARLGAGKQVEILL